MQPTLEGIARHGLLVLLDVVTDLESSRLTRLWRGQGLGIAILGILQ
jgi:hypothetical protein